MEHAGTIITGLVLLAIVAAIIFTIHRKRRKNKCARSFSYSRSFGCANCSCGCGKENHWM